ncbi:WD domain protein [Elasticomyces elasticus]|uniref:WD domain protein n=1 Tax=Exophiala sideris TaxID=1016849 RepID=A0ABR0IZS2_9EURO|nr:WD domain protein [Elasticomyces elasticus]KAK5023479.1 WD domain protein [Exophiala sideris]KAK5028146.1 WD domain protein [Exophiala sideris]KAK5052804.1 WD domain protein [Exophiala sideris]KAK5178415.1 WD domain protein [Eurotiomycetes sp. CCFEE 6388]
MAHLVGDDHEVNQAPGDDLVEVPLAAPPTTLHPSSKMSIFVREQDGTRGQGRGPAPTLLLLSKPLKFTPLATIPRAHARGITSLKFSPDMALLATASADNAINIYSVPPNPTPDTPFKHLRTLRAHLAGVNAIAWSPIGPNYTLASASDDKSILLWSPLSSDFPISPSPLIGHSNYVYSLAFSPKGNMLVSGSYDEAVFLWDVRAGRVMRSLPAHSDPVGGVDFLRDGTMVCSCAGDGLIRIWDAGTGQCLKTLVDEDRRPVTNVRFTPNGKYVVAWTLDNSIRLWRYTEGTCVKTYQGHVNQKYSLGGVVGSYSSTHATQAFVASGSEDGDVLVWDITSKEVLWRGRGHSDVVLGVDFGRTKSGKGLLVSGGRDRDVRLWLLEGANEDKRDVTGAADTDMDPNMTADMMDVDGMPDGGEHLHGRAAVENGVDVDMDTPRRENS